jgi:DNA primase
MAFPTAFLEELKARAGLVATVGKRVRLIKRGREHLGLCPFHKEKTPSFTVNEDKGFYHCFGCGKHGSVFDFVMETEGVTFPEAVERLAREAGLELPARDPESRARDESRGALLPAMEAACAFFERSLRMPEGRGALEYLHGRGLADETIAEFRLGHAPDSRGGLKAALIREGFAEERLIEAGLLIKPDEGNSYDRFRGRVMFPIQDRRGRVIAFGGRILGDGEPKYLNSPETPLFHKGASLYALSRALAAVRAKGAIAVVEGYMDAIALHQAGIKNVVAPLGTALTEEQIQLLWTLAPEPVICLDGDKAGINAAGRVIERALPILKAGNSLRIAFLPDGEDPDSLIRQQGADAMRGLLMSAKPVSEILWIYEKSTRNLGTPEARAQLERRLDEHAGKIQDRAVREHFRRYFREKIFDALRPARTKTSPIGGPASSAPNFAVKAALAEPFDSRIEAERFMLALAATHCRLFSEIEEELGTVHFADARLDRLRQELLRVLGRAGEGWTAAEAAALLGDPALAATLAEVLAHPPIKAHRLVRPEAALADVRAAWAENARLHARLAARDDPGKAGEAETLTAESEAWERRRAALEARLGGDEAAE